MTFSNTGRSPTISVRSIIRRRPAARAKLPNGLDSPGLLTLLQDTPCARFDVVVLSVGANDATCLCSPLQWARWKARLAELIDKRFALALLVHSAVAPDACLPGATAAAALVHGPLGAANEP